VNPLTDDLEHVLADTPLYVQTGISLEGAEPGLVALSFNPGPVHRNIQGLVHGGMLALLADTAMGLAVRTELPPGRPHVTVQLGIRYLRPVTSEQGSLIANGRTTKVGRTLAFATAEISLADGALIATADATISVAEPWA
jgi:uncharacterized protein (TIGR00369 family)